MKDRVVNCKTIKNDILISGKGIHTGKEVEIRLIKSFERGIYFNIHRDGKTEKFEVYPGNIINTINQVTLGNDSINIKLIEHILSAFHGLGITNCIVESHSPEVPGMDGSSYPFVKAICESGVKELDEKIKVFEIPFPVWVKNKNGFIVILPNDHLTINYTQDSKYKSIGKQCFYSVVNEKTYINEISKARTFGFIEDHEKLLNQGKCIGSGFDNTLVLSRDKVLSSEVRFTNEPARHKVLDIIGDLYILSSPIKGKVIAYNSSHLLDFELVNKLLRVKERKFFSKEEISEQFSEFHEMEFTKKIFS